MPSTATRVTRDSFQVFVIVAAVGCWLQPASAGSSLTLGDPTACLLEVQPVDGIGAAPRIAQCTQGNFHPNGFVLPDDPSFFQTAESGIPLSNDYLNAFTGGPTPIVPSDVDLSENNSGVTTFAHVDSAAAHTSTAIVVENRGSTLLAPALDPALSTAGAGWSSYSSVEVIPFQSGGSSDPLPISIVAEFAGQFFGTGGTGERLNSQLEYNVTVQSRTAGTGELVERGSLFGYVGFDQHGTVVGDGNVAQMQVTIKPDGRGDAQAFFFPLQFDYLPADEESLVITTSFSGFGSFAQDVGSAVADGSETGIARISSPDGSVRFRHSPDLFELLPGDTAPLDGAVNIDDLNRVRNHFGSGNGSDTSGIAGDTFPFDGLVNVDDLNAVRNSFGAGATTVPEPSGLALLLLAVSALMCWRRHQR